jgi:hypothetical protein
LHLAFQSCYTRPNAAIGQIAPPAARVSLGIDRSFDAINRANVNPAAQNTLAGVLVSGQWCPPHPLNLV